jgi:hypothetical protein
MRYQADVITRNVRLSQSSVCTVLYSSVSNTAEALHVWRMITLETAIDASKSALDFDMVCIITQPYLALHTREYAVDRVLSLRGKAQSIMQRYHRARYWDPPFTWKGHFSPTLKGVSHWVFVSMANTIWKKSVLIQDLHGGTRTGQRSRSNLLQTALRIV